VSEGREPPDDELSEEELEGHDVEELPDREAMSVIRGDVTIPLDPDALDVPQGLKQQLGKLVGGDVRLVFEVADPNRKVSVPRPATG
jgi:hypothetical protein